MSTKLTFTTPIKDVNGAPLSAAVLAALTYEALIDTVNPPLKAYPVPAANIAAGVANPDGSKTVTVLFTDIGFAPAPNVQYFATASDSFGTLTAGDANIVSFTIAVAPAPPSNFSVS